MASLLFERKRERKFLYLQLWKFNNKRLLNKPYIGEVLLKKQKLSLKCCYPLELFTYFCGNIGSVGQRAEKLPTVKVWGLKKKSANSAITGKSVCKRVRPGFKFAKGKIIHKDWWTATLQPFDLRTSYHLYWKI